MSIFIFVTQHYWGSQSVWRLIEKRLWQAFSDILAVTDKRIAMAVWSRTSFTVLRHRLPMSWRHNTVDSKYTIPGCAFAWGGCWGNGQEERLYENTTPISLKGGFIYTIIWGSFFSKQWAFDRHLHIESHFYRKSRWSVWYIQATFMRYSLQISDQTHRFSSKTHFLKNDHVQTVGTSWFGRKRSLRGVPTAKQRF